MPKDLVSQEEMEELAPLVVEEITDYINSHDDFKVIGDEILIYALAQVISNKIEAIDLTEEDKGAVASSIISGLVELHEGPLALHREVLRSLIEQKSSTVH